MVERIRNLEWNVWVITTKTKSRVAAILYNRYREQSGVNPLQPPQTAEWRQSSTTTPESRVPAILYNRSREKSAGNRHFLPLTQLT